MDEADSMDNTPKKGVLCMKVQAGRELSPHDTDALIKRLANSEKSRRTMLDHHERRRWRSRMNGDMNSCDTLAS